MWQTLIDILLFIPRKTLELLLDALMAVIDSIPPPDFIQNIPNIVSQIPPSVWYWVDPFNIPAGMGIIIGAYIIRFIIRRIPFIG